MLRLVLVLTVASLMSGCVSFATLQTARTLKPGKASFHVAGGYETFGVEHEDIDGNTQTDQIKLPVIEYGFRYGVRDGVDAGLKTTILGTYFGDVKFRALQTSKYALAAGVGLAYQSFSFGDNEDKTTVSTVEYHLPIYNSFTVTEGVDLYLTPRLVYRSVNGAGGSSLGGASAGFVIGKEIAFVAEGAYFKALGEGDGVQQVMLGVIFGYDNLDRGDGSDERRAKKKRGKS